MADIVVTADKVGRSVANQVEDVVDLIAVEAITAGQAIYITTAGKAGVADANVAGKQQFRGIALKAAAIGGIVPVLKRGFVEGFTLTGVNFDALVYLSDTAGALADAVGTLTVNCGRVQALPIYDTAGALKKVLYIEADWLRTWV
jgi:hypothetical protein